MRQTVEEGIITGHEPSSDGQPSELQAEDEDGDKPEKKLRNGDADHSGDGEHRVSGSTSM